MKSAILELPDGWRKTNLTWRPSLLDVLPSLTVYGEDLSAEEKKALGLSAKRSLPHYAEERFDHWFVRRAVVTGGVGPGRERSGNQLLPFDRLNLAAEILGVAEPSGEAGQADAPEREEDHRRHPDAARSGGHALADPPPGAVTFV